MLETILFAVEEIAAEMGVEIAHAPLRFAAEVVQFVLLIAIVWVVAVGFGKRRGFVANMLTERAHTVSGRLEASSHAEEDLKHAQQVAALKIRTANADARRVLADARREAEEFEASARNDADAEAKRILDRADTALATERAEMHLEVREELVELVSQATRSIMNEKVPLAEQRKLIETAILAGIGSEDGGAPAVAADLTARMH